MKKSDKEVIKIQIAIALRTLLQYNKEYARKKEKYVEIIDSYEKIALNADIRKATVTSAIKGSTRTAMTTVIIIIIIIEAMGFTLNDFSKIYSEIDSKQISDFRARK